MNEEKILKELREIKKLLKEKKKKKILTAAVLSMISFSSLGIYFLFGVLYNPNSFFFPMMAIESAKMSRKVEIDSSNPIIKELAKNITEECLNEAETLNVTWPSIIFSCKVNKAVDYLKKNFRYVGDWEFGVFDETTNMIIQNKTGGDCEDWAVTFCSLLVSMKISCVPKIVDRHVIAFINENGEWKPIEPQTGVKGIVPSFRGYVI